MIIKQNPEDFIVKEKTKIKILDKKPEGEWFGIYEIKKNSLSTEDVIDILCSRFKLKRRSIGYAGLKDKNAVTTQLFSIRKREINEIKSDKVYVKLLGYSKEPISLGLLEGNDFEIVIRDLDKNIKVKKIDRFPNYFDSQRFSVSNVEIGRVLVKKEYKKAIELLKEDRVKSKMIKRYLSRFPNDYIGALKTIPIKMLRLYIHSFQSELFNKMLDEIIKDKKDKKNNKKKNEKLPLIGFTTKETEKIKSILKKEGITLKDFINKSIPELTVEGMMRDSYCKIENLKIFPLEKDEINKGRYKIKVSFFLKKGSYATEAIKHILA